MKRWTAALLALLMTLGLAAPGLAEGGPRLVVSTEEAAPGGTVTLTVTMEENPGIFAMSLPIEYDETRLGAPEIEGVGSVWTIGESAQWESAAMADSDHNGVILRLTFPVRADAPEGFASVSVGPVLAGNLNEERVGFAVTEGGVNVAGEPADRTDTVSAPPAETAAPAAVSTRPEEETAPRWGVHEHDWGDWILTTFPSGGDPGEETCECFTCHARQARVFVSPLR